MSPSGRSNLARFAPIAGWMPTDPGGHAARNPGMLGMTQSVGDEGQKGLMCSMEASFDRTHSDSEHLSGGICIELFNVAEHDNRTMSLRESIQGITNHLSALGRFQFLRGV